MTKPPIKQPTPINRGLISRFFRQLFPDLITSRLLEGGRLMEVTTMGELSLGRPKGDFRTGSVPSNNFV